MGWEGLLLAPGSGLGQGSGSGRGQAQPLLYTDRLTPVVYSRGARLRAGQAQPLLLTPHCDKRQGRIEGLS